MKLKEKSSFWFYSSVFLVLVIFDQLSKFIASKLFFIYCNRGIAFGIGQRGLVLSLAALLIVLFLLTREKGYRKKISLLIIFGAGCSNLLDRVFFGCVRDFINIGIIPTFNLADSMITVGVFLFLINMVQKNVNES